MKRAIAALLCFLMSFLPFSCEYQDESEDTQPSVENETFEDTENALKTVISKRFFKIQNDGARSYYYIYDNKKNVIFSGETTQDISISFVEGQEDKLLDIAIKNKNGIIEHEYFDIPTKKLSDKFTNVLAISGEYIAYYPTNNKIVARNIFDAEKFYGSHLLYYYGSDTKIKSAKFTTNNYSIAVCYTFNDFTYTEVFPVLSPWTLEECSFIYESRPENTCYAYIKEDKTSLTVPSHSAIGEQVTSISALETLYKLNTLTLPATIKDIGYIGQNVSTIIYGGSEKEWNNIHKPYTTIYATKLYLADEEDRVLTGPIIADFSSYSAIISTYNNITTLFPKQYPAEILENIHYKPYDIFIFKNEQEREWFDEIFFSAWSFYPSGNYHYSSPANRLGFGYDIKDINLDGTDELILLNRDYSVIAIFTLKDGSPVFVKGFDESKLCHLDKQGRIHIIEQCEKCWKEDYTITQTKSIYELSKDSAELMRLARYSCHVCRNENHTLEYFKLENENEIKITEEEYTELSSAYCDDRWYVFHDNAAGLKFTAALAPTEEEIVRQRMQFILDVQRYGQYAFVDMDGDGIEELIIKNEKTTVYKYENGNIYSHFFNDDQMSTIYSDGSFLWNTLSTNYRYGGSRISLNKNGYKTECEWRVAVEDGLCVEFYINDEEVTKEELDEFLSKKREVLFLDVNHGSLHIYDDVGKG